jgi:hypothetical protein
VNRVLAAATQEDEDDLRQMEMDAMVRQRREGGGGGREVDVDDDHMEPQRTIRGIRSHGACSCLACVFIAARTRGGAERAARRQESGHNDDL